MRYVLLIGILLAGPAWASNPEQPLDCTDWVFLLPGLSCGNYARPCVDSVFCTTDLGQLARDNEGYQYRIEIRTVAICGASLPVRRYELRRFNGATEEVVAYIDDRCNGGVLSAEFDEIVLSSFFFDEEVGAMIIAAWVNSSHSNYAPFNWHMRIEGFITTFEVLQSFEPTPDQFGFRVPYMPEGFPAADWFNTYYGDLATVGDWSQAQPLQCAFPVTMPNTGDYLTVNDPLSDPAPGMGRYYVTSVNHQGQIRYGRKNVGGVLSGRDPGVLPACN